MAEIKQRKIDDDQLALAKYLIKRKVALFEPEKVTEEYETASRMRINAKAKHLPKDFMHGALMRSWLRNWQGSLHSSGQSQRKWRKLDR